MVLVLLIGTPTSCLLDQGWLWFVRAVLSESLFACLRHSKWGKQLAARCLKICHPLPSDKSDLGKFLSTPGLKRSLILLVTRPRHFSLLGSALRLLLLVVRLEAQIVL